MKISRIAFVCCLCLFTLIANAARSKCKFAGGCSEFADAGHQFCPEHECHSEGCTRGVVTVNRPQWATASWNKGSNLTKQQKAATTRKYYLRYCSAHRCARMCPQNKLDDDCFRFVEHADNEHAVEFLYCNSERLADSRYCINHACRVKTCSSAIGECWKQKSGMRASFNGWHYFVPFANWVVEGTLMCRAHQSLDPESVPPRSGKSAQTEGDRYRLRNSPKGEEGTEPSHN